MSLSTVVMCREIRCVNGGYIVEIRDGAIPGDYPETICKTFDEVIELLRKNDPATWNMWSNPHPVKP